MSPEAGQARERARLALARANRAGQRAQRYDQLAAEGPLGLRLLYEELAASQRRTGERHRASARIQVAYAQRIIESRRRLSDPAAVAGLIEAVADALGVDSVAVALRSSGRGDATVVTSDTRAHHVQDAELILAEGPSRHATESSAQVGVGARELTARWPRFAAAVEPLALQSVAAVPLKVGDSTMGALTVLDPPWSSPAAGLPGLTSVGEALMDTLLEDLQAAGGTLGGTPVLIGDVMPVVHRAAGMIAARRGCTPQDGVALIQARAYAEGLGTTQVALEITEGRLDLAD